MSDIEERVDKLESLLVEQEHRPFKIIGNFIEAYRGDKSEDFKKSAYKAFIYRLFFSPAVIASGGVVIGVLTLLLLYWQNEKFDEQNALILDQNKFFRQQILQNSVKSEFNLLYNDSINSNRKVISLKEMLDYQKLYGDQGSNRVFYLDEVDFSYANFSIHDTISNVDFSGSKLSECVFDSIVFINCTFEGIGVYPDDYFSTNSDKYLRISMINCTFIDCQIDLLTLLFCDISYSNIFGLRIIDNFTIYDKINSNIDDKTIAFDLRGVSIKADQYLSDPRFSYNSIESVFNEVDSLYSSLDSIYYKVKKIDSINYGYIKDKRTFLIDEYLITRQKWYEGISILGYINVKHDLTIEDSIPMIPVVWHEGYFD